MDSTATYLLHQQRFQIRGTKLNNHRRASGSTDNQKNSKISKKNSNFELRKNDGDLDGQHEQHFFK